MNNFPFNILSTVQTAIGKQAYQLQKYLGRTNNVAGFQVSSFDAPIDMMGSVQPVNQRQYKDMGLDFKKSYIRIYDAGLIESLSRDKNADRIIYDGFLFEVAEDTPWFLSGGWTYVLCVRLEKHLP
jgi:hypothetical protein